MERRQSTPDTTPTNVSAENESDLELLRELSRRSEEAAHEKAWRELVERYKSHVYRIALHVSRNPETAEEIVQEVFLDLFRAWRKGWAANQSLRGWLSAVTVRKAMRALRKGRRAVSRIKEFAADPAARETNEERQRTEACGVVLDLVENLPETLRLPVVMYYAGELKQREIARELRCSQNVVSERIQRALEQLKTGLRKAGFDSLPATLPALLSQALALGSAPSTLTLDWTQCVKSAAEQSVKAAGGLSAGKVAAIALAVICLASAGGVYLHFIDDPKPNDASLSVEQETPPKSTSDQPKNQSAPVQDKLLLSWDFDASPEKFDLLHHYFHLSPEDEYGVKLNYSDSPTKNGKVEWLPNRGNGGGALLLNDKGIILPYSATVQPVRLSFEFIGHADSYGYVHGLCLWPQKKVINPFGFKKKTIPIGVPPSLRKELAKGADQAARRWRRIECFYWMTRDGKRNTFVLMDGEFTFLGSYLPIPDQEVRFHIIGCELIIDNVKIIRSTDEDARWLAKNFSDGFLELREEKKKKNADDGDESKSDERQEK